MSEGARLIYHSKDKDCLSCAFLSQRLPARPVKHADEKHYRPHVRIVS